MVGIGIFKYSKENKKKNNIINDFEAKYYDLGYNLRPTETIWVN